MSDFALPLPNGKMQYVDLDGAPLVGGTVAFYEPSTLNPKDTFQDYGASILNANPVTLDSRGQAIIWGQGRYRQIVKDSLGNQIWDQETAVLTDRPYEVGFYFPDAPNANDIIFEFNFTQAVTFPTNWAGGFGNVVTPPGSDTMVDIKHGVGGGITTIGALSVLAAGSVSATSSVSNPSFQPGERIRVQIQGGGANGLAGLSMTFLGALS